MTTVPGTWKMATEKLTTDSKIKPVQILKFKTIKRAMNSD
jgi:hypothetical protein